MLHNQFIQGEQPRLSAGLLGWLKVDDQDGGGGIQRLVCGSGVCTLARLPAHSWTTAFLARCHMSISQVQAGCKQHAGCSSTARKQAGGACAPVRRASLGTSRYCRLLGSRSAECTILRGAEGTEPGDKRPPSHECHKIKRQLRATRNRTSACKTARQAGTVLLHTGGVLPTLLPTVPTLLLPTLCFPTCGWAGPTGAACRSRGSTLAGGSPASNACHRGCEHAPMAQTQRQRGAAADNAWPRKA